MGLTIHSVGELPCEARRGYYLYVLDYGWEEPIGDALRSNFQQMAGLASRHDAVVMQGVVGSHFVDEVLSWHHINGRDAEGLLPGLLITTRHPREFHEQVFEDNPSTSDHAIILIPMKKICKTATDVVDLVSRIFEDIAEGKELKHFEIADTMRRGSNGAITDALILQPNFVGLGVDLKKLFGFFKDPKGKTDHA